MQEPSRSHPACCRPRPLSPPHGLSFAVLAAAGLSSLASPLAAAEGSTSLLEMIRMGGWAMWPLIGSSLLACHFIVALSLDLRPSRFLPVPSRRALRERLEQFGTVQTHAWLSGHDHPGARLLAETTERTASEEPPGSAHTAETLSDGIARIEGELSARIQYLSIIASVAPMIGLLGTVSGMIGAFQTISGGGMGKAEMLAGDIGEALITTAAGLIVGIPAMVAYFMLRSRLQARLATLGELGETLIEAVRRERWQQSSGAQAASL